MLLLIQGFDRAPGRRSYRRQLGQNVDLPLDDLRSVVVYNMPFNDPGTLSKHQYADVLAYLLAANCYPAGNKPFPESGSDALSKLHVEPPGSMHPTDEKTGVCSVN